MFCSRRRQLPPRGETTFKAHNGSTSVRTASAGVSIPSQAAERLVTFAAACSRGNDRSVALFSAVENASGRAAIFRWAQSLHFSLQDRGRRIEWPALERDQ